MKLTDEERELIEPIDQAALLARTERWSAINSGTGNLAGLQRQAEELAEAFSALPGEVELREAAPVTSVDAGGNEVDTAHGRHLVLRVRPEAERRFLLTGHMDTVYPAQHPFQQGRWLDADTYNAPGAADMKGGLAVMLAALQAFEASSPAAGYDVMINSDEETGSLSSAALLAQLARGKAAALTYEPAALPDGTLAHSRGGSGNYSLVVVGRSAHAGRNPQDGRSPLSRPSHRPRDRRRRHAADDLVQRVHAVEGVPGLLPVGSRIWRADPPRPSEGAASHHEAGAGAGRDRDGRYQRGPAG